jgi:hypothetical protein
MEIGKWKRDKDNAEAQRFAEDERRRGTVTQRSQREEHRVHRERQEKDNAETQSAQRKRRSLRV